MEERILAERCKAGDNDARRELYTRFGGRLLGICLRYVGDRATAEDLLHDCFIKVFAAIDRFSWRGEGSLRAWMERIAVNVSLEALRQKRRLHYPTTVDRLPERYEEPTSDEMERLPYDDLKRPSCPTDTGLFSTSIVSRSSPIGRLRSGWESVRKPRRRSCFAQRPCWRGALRSM